MKLRDYQREAVDSIYAYFTRHDGHPLIVSPTGSGKSLILAAFVQETLQTWPTQRIMILTHVRELIQQNHAKLTTIWPQAPAGIYSAGLGRRDTVYPITFAGIQSVHSKSKLFGHVDLVIIDEAHLVSKRSEGMYRTFLSALEARNPALKVIGLTATPYRLKGGLLHEGDERLFTHIAYEVDLLRLIAAGYLCKLVPKQVDAAIDTSAVHVRGGEFVAKELEAAAEAGDIIPRSVDEIVQHGHDRRSWLLFCCGVDHARKVREEVASRGVAVEAVFGDTPKAERDAIIADYRAGTLQAIVNVNVLTVGFDAPETDLIVLLRPTQSPGLYVQMVGRGCRIAPGKADCRVLDFGGNVERHGPIDAVTPPGGGHRPEGSMAKTCPKCRTQVFVLASVCPECLYEWPRPERTDFGIPSHRSEAGTAPLLSSDGTNNRHEVLFVTYRRHTKPDKPDSMRVDYVCSGLNSRFSEWVCFEHGGRARQKAEHWWMIRSGEAREIVPAEVSGALELAEWLKKPAYITTRRNGKFDEIIKYEWDQDDDSSLEPQRTGPDAGRAEGRDPAAG